MRKFRKTMHKHVLGIMRYMSQNLKQGRGHIPAMLLLLLLCSISVNASSGIEYPDSVKSMTEEEKLNWLFDYGESHSSSDIEISIKAFKLAEQRAIELGNDSILVRIQSSLAQQLLLEGLYDESLAFSYTGKGLAQKLRDTTAWVWLLYWESGAYNELGAFQKSIDASNMAVLLDSLNTLTAPNPWGLNSLGEAYRFKGDYPKAEAAYIEAYEFSLKDTVGIEENEQRERLKILENNLAFLYLELEEYEKAQVYLDRSQQGNIENENIILYLETNFCQVLIYEKTGRGKFAEVLALKMLAKSHEKEAFRHEYKYAEWLTNHYKKTGNFEEAIYFLERSNKMDREIDSGQAVIRIALHEIKLENMQMHNDKIQKEKEFVWMAESSKRKNTFIFILAIGICLVFGFFVWAMLLSRRVRKQKDQISDQVNILFKKNEELESLNEEKDNLMGVVAHDIRAPLNKTLALAGLVRSSGDVNENQSKFLDMIQQVGEDGEKLIQELLDLHSFENGTIECKKLELDLVEVIEASCAYFDAAAQKKGIILKSEIASEDTVIQSDKHLVTRIVDNLVSNAVKFSKSGEAVTVSLVSEPEHIQIAIKDEGPGISPKDQEKLFQKFARLGARPTGGESSTGLGLSIVKVLIEKLGGTIKVESRLGIGTTFFVELPRK